MSLYYLGILGELGSIAPVTGTLTATTKKPATVIAGKLNVSATITAATRKPLTVITCKLATGMVQVIWFD